MSQKVRKVVIPVAGLGTRGLPFTKEIPKEMLPIIDKPTVHYIVEEVTAAGIEQVIFVTSKGKSVLEDYFDLSPNLEHWLHKRGKEQLAERISEIGKMCEFVSVRQKEPLGLGHAIFCARSVIGNERFAVCLGDEIFPPWSPDTEKKNGLAALIEIAQVTGNSLVGVVEIPPSDSPSYGMIDIGDSEIHSGPVKVRRTVEKPKPEDAPSRFAIIGRYVFEPSLFGHLEKIKPGVGGELQLTDAMDRLCAEGSLHAFLMSGPRYDIGNQLSYLQAQIDEALRRPHLAPRLRSYLEKL